MLGKGTKTKWPQVSECGTDACCCVKPGTGIGAICDIITKLMSRTGCFNGARSERAVSFVSARSPWHVGLQTDVGAAASGGGGARRGRFEPLLLLFHSLLQHVDLPREQVERGRYRQLAGDRQKKFVPMVCGDAHAEKNKNQLFHSQPYF